MKDWLENHRLVRRLVLLWACALITWTTIQVFTDVSKITGAVVSALGVVVGILTTVIGFYMHQRGQDN